LELREDKVYEAIYLAVKSVFDEALERAAAKARSAGRSVDKGDVLLDLIYEAIREGAYRAFREVLASKLARGALEPG